MNPPVIEDSITIDATAERVWQLVSEPGWWINGGTYREHVTHERDGIVHVTDPEHGTFQIRVERVDAPHYVAYRWLDRDDPGSPGTLTEMWIVERDGGVTLRVRESGFESLGLDDVELRRQIDDNTSGWATELAVARSWSEA